MRVYLAGTFGEYPQYQHKLESFLTFRKGRVLSEMYPRPIFLDSGAFTMFTQGESIALEEYARFIDENKAGIEFAANLDFIGAQTLTESAERTMENQKRLESLVKGGTYVLPVFHVREDVKYLEAMVKRYPFIALGAMVPESKRDLGRLLDELWGNVLTDKHGRPKVKVHGFGLTTYDYMLRYPWWSVDSTAWALQAGFGYITYLVGETKVVVHISDQSEARRYVGKHYDSMTDAERAQVDAVLASRGFTADQMRVDYKPRREFNAYTYAEQIPVVAARHDVFKKPFKGFFDER
jgi:hypothetical protein